MRIKLELQISGRGTTLPINYQYEFSAWIYKIIHTGDARFADWLHNNGYTVGQKTFKLFTFSNLEVDRFKVFRDRFKIIGNKAVLYISFHIDEALQYFVSGIFQKRNFSIGDRKSRVDFEVKSVETLPTPELSGKTDTVYFHALSPICVTKPVEVNGSLNAEYLSPEHSEYEQRFFDNLVTRYKAAHSEVKGEFERKEDFKLNVSGKPKSRLVKIKADTPQETQIRGWLYNFECRAPAELLKFGYEAGFAEKNSLGFGCVEII